MLNRFVSLMTVVVLGAGIAACDPCSGVASCDRPLCVSLNGRIIDFPGERGVSGVDVAVRVGDSTRTVRTDGDGFWQASLGVTTDDAVVSATITVTSAASPAPYVVADVMVPTSRRRGDGIDVGRWYAQPQLRFVGEVRARAGVSLSGATVRVDRVGGVDGTVDGLVSRIGTDRRFIVEAPAGAVGTMLVRLTFSGPGLSRTFVQDSLPVLTMYRDTTANVQGVYSVGAGFPYRLRVLRRGTDGGLAGATVVFRRTGGVDTELDSVRVTTDAEGYAPIDLRPTEPGTVLASVRIAATGVPTETYAGLSYETADDDVARFAGNFSVGRQMAGAIDVYRRGAIRRLAGAPWTFTPRSGPVTTPLSGVADARGAIFLRLPATQAGAVRGDLAVQWAVGRPPDTLDITVPVVADDSIRFLGFVGAGPSLHYGGALQDIDGFVPIVGAGVEFRRTGGVAVEEAVFRWTTNEIGVFQYSSPPLEDGEVIGDLTFRLPPPYRDTTFTGIRLSTFRTDEFRLGPLLRVRKP
jgi:hypothetical protein